MRSDRFHLGGDLGYVGFRIAGRGAWPAGFVVASCPACTLGGPSGCTEPCRPWVCGFSVRDLGIVYFVATCLYLLGPLFPQWESSFVFSLVPCMFAEVYQTPGSVLPQTGNGPALKVLGRCGQDRDSCVEAACVGWPPWQCLESIPGRGLAQGSSGREQASWRNLQRIAGVSRPGRGKGVPSRSLS